MMRRGEEGMALITVLLIVALASGILVLMLDAQDAGVQRASRLRDAAAADAAVAGGELSAIAALRRDGAVAPETDNAAEPWAHIADRATPIRGGTFSLAITDAQGKFNVNALASGDIIAAALMAGIVDTLRLPPAVAVQAAALLRATGPIADLGQLALAGIDGAAIARLATLCTALPGNAPINLNGADVRLLEMLAGDPASGRLLAGRRDSQGYLVPGDLALARIAPPPGTGFTSHLYWVRTRVTIGGTTRERTSLLQRRGTGAATEVRAIGQWIGAAAPLAARQAHRVPRETIVYIPRP